MKTVCVGPSPAPMVGFGGIGVSDGIAIGIAFVLEGRIAQVPEFTVEPDATDGEVARFRAALAKARQQILKLRRKTEALPETVLAELGPLLDAHAPMMAPHRLGAGVQASIRTRRLNPAAAVPAVLPALGGARA